MDTDLLIQKHYKNELTSDDQVLFDDLLQNNADFKQKLQFHKDLNLAIKAEERSALKKELQDLNVDKKGSLFSRFMIAASFALLFSIGSYFMFKNNETMSNQELFATNFEPYRNVMHPIVRGEENLTQIETAFVYYENGNFAKFIEIIENSNFKNIDYNFYIANAYLAEGNIEKSKLILEDYRKNNKAKFLTKANWYLGLIYLKEDANNKAKLAFKQVKKEGNFNLKKVTELLKNLD